MEGEEEGEEGSCKQQRKFKKRHIQGYDSAYEEAEVEPLRIQVEAGCLAIFKLGIKHGSAFLDGCRGGVFLRHAIVTRRAETRQGFRELGAQVSREGRMGP